MTDNYNKTLTPAQAEGLRKLRHIALDMDGTIYLVTLINIPINVAIMRTVDKGMLSKVSSITSVASQGLTPIASVLAGAILQGAGSAALLFFCAAGFAAAAAYLLLNKRVKEI